MPSPLNTPTSDQESKSIFDSSENLTTLNSNKTNINLDNNNNDEQIDCNHLITSTPLLTQQSNESNAQQSQQTLINNKDSDVASISISLSLLSSSSSSSSNLIKMATTVSSLSSNESEDSLLSSPPIMQKLIDKSIIHNNDQQISQSQSSTPEVITAEQDEQEIWQHNSSLKYRRARLNLNLVPLKNLSLPQISPTPNCYQNNTNNINKIDINNGTKLKTNEKFSFNDQNNQSMTMSTSSSALNDRDSTFLLIKPPRILSPKYNAKHFEPIISFINGHSSLDNVINNNLDYQQNGKSYNESSQQQHSSLNSINNGEKDSNQSNNNDQRFNSKGFFQNGSTVRSYGKYSIPNVKCFEYQNAIRIDPNLDLEQQDWFHGYINRQEAERILARKQVGSYLVRRCKHFYTISLKSIFGCIHFRLFLCSQSRKWSLGPNCDKHGTEKSNENQCNGVKKFEQISLTSFFKSSSCNQFDTIPQLIDYFTIHHLPLNGCEHMAFLFPVAVRLL